MVERPRLKAHLSAHVVPPDELFLLGDDRQHLIESRAAVRLVPLLDGTRTAAQIALELSDIPFGEVMGALSALDRGGHLADGNGVVEGAAWWEAVGVDSSAASAAVAEAVVGVTGVGAVPELDSFVATLEASGLRAAAGEGNPQVVLVEDYLCSELDELNRSCLKRGRPWLIAKAQGETLWLGPHFRPGATGCWRCLAFRLERNRHVEGYIARSRAERPRRPAASAPGAAQAAAGLLARELHAIAATGRSELLDGRVLTVRRDLGTLEHELIRRPQCPACGAGADAYGGPRVDLEPRAKGQVAGGAYRSVSAEETVARLEKHVSPITGAVAWLADLTEPGDTGHTFWAGHWFPILSSERGAAVLRQNVRGRSGGKGPTAAQARASAICESLERYSGCFFGDEPRTRASLDTLGERAIPIEELTLYSDRQYETRGEWNRQQHSELQLVPHPLPRDRAVDWTECWSLTRAEPRLVPTAYCYYGHPDIADWDHFFCAGDSNGQGAGNTLEEAVTQGLMELVERDGVAIWWYNRLRVAGVDLDSFGLPWLDRVRSEYAAAGREIWALDLTTDLGIPVFVAVSKLVDSENEDLIFGFGAHIEPQLAMTRAFSELNQFLPAVRRGEDGEFALDDPDALWWWANSSLEADPYLVADPAASPRALPDFPERAGDDLAEDIRTCIELLDDAGLETIVVDQSRPDIELRVAKVMVPGMRHFWRRLREGRLYEVPVKLGRLDAPLREDELNPKNIWF